jgi:hypothetical protein
MKRESVDGDPMRVAFSNGTFHNVIAECYTSNQAAIVAGVLVKV